MFKLIHQSQPTDRTCVVTCMAMLAGRPVQDLIEEGFDDLYRSADGSTRKLLEKLEQPFHAFCTVDDTGLVPREGGGVYLVGVPSLNIRGGMHQVLVEMTEDCDWQVLDPNRGAAHLRPDGGKPLYYVGMQHARNEFEVELGAGYTVDAYIAYKDLGIGLEV